MNGNTYKIAMVGLDLTAMDDTIIRYLPTLLKALPLERVIFVHIAKELELPDEIIKKYPDVIAPLDENIADGINSTIKDIFENTGVDYDIIVREGTPLENFLKLAKIKNVDLIVMGRKKELEGSGLLAGHIVRKSPTSLLLITENNTPSIDTVLVPVDFSRHSSMALSLGQEVCKRTGADLKFSHVYKVPIGYHKTGKSFEEFAQIMKTHAESDFVRFCESNGVKDHPTCDFLLSDDKPVPKLIYESARKSNSDLIIIGSRGRTRTSALLIGSIVEKLVLKDSDIPVLVVKNKGESMSFFEAIMNI